MEGGKCVRHLCTLCHSPNGERQELIKVLLGQGQSGNLGNKSLYVELITKCLTRSWALSQRVELSHDGLT